MKHIDLPYPFRSYRLVKNKKELFFEKDYSLISIKHQRKVKEEENEILR